MATATQSTFDYIVVGSGAGGGPVAANLAAAGFTVLLIEAGSDDSGGRNLNYEVPGFHGQATEDPTMRWDFWVRHYENLDQQKQDSKYYRVYPPDDQPGPHEPVDGVLYPRCGTLGGCTAHNAMITIYPHESDWEEIAGIAQTYDTGDSTWDPVNMRGYFERIERCGYIKHVDPDLKTWRHGDSGYLGTSMADPSLILGDTELLKVVIGAVNQTLLDLKPKTLEEKLEDLEQFLEGQGSTLQQLLGGDPKDLASKIPALWKLLDPNRYPRLPQQEGAYLIPLAVADGRRNGSRERILQVQAEHPDRLTVQTSALATKIVLDGGRAVGVEYLEGTRLYRAAPPDSTRTPPGTQVRAEARREVIIAGGTFNTPQLLMLSGIGPKDDLERMGIPIVLDRPAVGRFLQDRYEVAVISESPEDFSTLDGLLFRQPKAGEAPDRALKDWEDSKKGLYTTNGAIIAIIRRSSPDLKDPDLFIFGLPATFKGYYPFYADALSNAHNQFTWAILKAHTKNKGGYVRLRSTDPTERPEINFRYFNEGTDVDDDDLRAVVQGVKYVQEFTEKLGVKSHLLVKDFIQPGEEIRSDAQIADWVKAEAWGHHACGTCRIGPKDDVTESVLDSDFRVKGIAGLRVVDASVFPSIPGFFIVSSIYMIAEKASEAILRDAGQSLPDVNWPASQPNQGSDLAQ